MKKNVFLGIVVISVIFFETCGKVTKQNLNILDFILGKTQNTKQIDEEKIIEQLNKTEESRVEEGKGQVQLLSDEIIASPIINEQKLEEESLINVTEEKKKDEVFWSSFRGINSLQELLKNIQLNVNSLSLGRMSQEDQRKLLQKKVIIEESIKTFFTSSDAYERICAIEQIFMTYNSISEISAYFLIDISKDQINKIQETLYLDELNALKEKLIYVFKTDFNEKLKESIKTFQEQIDISCDLKEFSNNLSTEIKKIPNQLLESSQYEKVDKALKDINKPIVGDLNTKCNMLSNIITSYNEIKSIPFRLNKITAKSIKQLILKSVDDIFFEKMLTSLKFMEEKNYSDDLEKEDTEALTARNIKKTRFLLLGKVSSENEGKLIPGNIELFRNSEELIKKQQYLKDSINQFNITVNYFKQVSKNSDEISIISDNIDRIFEKISVYDNNSSPKNNISNEEESIQLINEEMQGEEYLISEN